MRAEYKIQICAGKMNGGAASGRPSEGNNIRGIGRCTKERQRSRGEYRKTRVARGNENANSYKGVEKWKRSEVFTDLVVEPKPTRLVKCRADHRRERFGNVVAIWYSLR